MNLILVTIDFHCMGKNSINIVYFAQHKNIRKAGNDMRVNK